MHQRIPSHGRQQNPPKRIPPQKRQPCAVADKCKISTNTRTQSIALQLFKDLSVGTIDDFLTQICALL